MKKVKDNFDLYWVDIEYSDNDKSKNRPCVLINVTAEDIRGLINASVSSNRLKLVLQENF